jgi:hypothetical protein
MLSEIRYIFPKMLGCDFELLSTDFNDLGLSDLKSVFKKPFQTHTSQEMIASGIEPGPLDL